LLQATHKFSSVWKRYQTALILLVIASLIPGTFGGLVQPRKDFYNELWAPAYLLVHGRSPYDTAALETPLPAVWLPMAIGAFAPLGWLSEELATQVWFLLGVGAVAAIVYLSMSLGGATLSAAKGSDEVISSPSIYVVASAALLAYFFPPTLNHFLLGQFSIIAMLCLLLAAEFAQRDRDWPAAAFLALGFTKPHLAVLAALGLGYFYFRQSGLGRAIKFGGKVLLAALVFSLPVLVVAPGWIADFLAGWQRNPTWAHPSVYVLLRMHLGDLGIILWAVLALSALAACLYVWRRYPPGPAMSWTLGLTLLASPYIWSWDFVLLLPVWIWAFAQVDWRRKIVLFASYLLGWAGMAYVQLAASGGNDLYWWVPWWFMGTAAIVTMWNGNPRA